MSEGITAGVDLGGTAIKGVACREDGTVLAREIRPTPGRMEFSSQTPPFAEAIRSLLEDIAPFRERVGISTPGIVSPDGSAVSCMPGRLAGLERFQWGQYLGCPASLINDAQSALLAETWKGAARDCSNVLLMTLGTGVGGAAIVDGRLLKGAVGRAGHVGHITVDFEGKPDICNTPGSLEDAIGNHQIATRSEGKFKRTSDLLDALKDGDADASRIWARSVRALAAGIVSLSNVLDPQRIVIGGGIAQAGDALFQPLSRELDKMEWRPCGHRVEIVPAALDQWAGAMGAAKNALDHASSSRDESSLPS